MWETHVILGTDLFMHVHPKSKVHQHCCHCDEGQEVFINSAFRETAMFPVFSLHTWEDCRRVENNPVYVARSCTTPAGQRQQRGVKGWVENCLQVTLSWRRRGFVKAYLLIWSLKDGPWESS